MATRRASLFVGIGAGALLLAACSGTSEKQSAPATTTITRPGATTPAGITGYENGAGAGISVVPTPGPGKAIVGPTGPSGAATGYCGPPTPGECARMSALVAWLGDHRSEFAALGTQVSGSSDGPPITINFLPGTITPAVRAYVRTHLPAEFDPQHVRFGESAFGQGL